jgi:hypothetical protein
MKQLNSNFNLQTSNLNEIDYDINFDNKFDIESLKEFYDYYALFNFSFYFKFQIDNKLINLVIHYGLLKLKCLQKERRNSLNYSYDKENLNESKYLHNFEIPDKENECKYLRSKKKDEFIQQYINMNDINRNIENLSLMFYNYVKESGMEILKMKKEKYRIFKER